MLLQGVAQKDAPPLSRGVRYQAETGGKNMIEYVERYENFIRQQGVGSNDKVADSAKSYISYLKGVSRHLDINISPSTLGCENDIQGLSLKLKSKGKISKKTITNYGSAMKQYVKMVQHFDL